MACGISNLACNLSAVSSTTWAFAAKSKGLRWPTPMNFVTGASTRTLHKFSSAIARPLYADDPIGIELDQSLYALDSTTIDLCLSMFPWAKFRKHKAAVKMHTLIDLHGNIPTFIHITDGKVHDVNVLDEILPEAGAFYVMDRGYIDFERLFIFEMSSAFFVVRTKENVLLPRRYSRPIDKTTGLRADHTVILTSLESAKVYPDALRRITFVDKQSNKRLKFFTNI